MKSIDTVERSHKEGGILVGAVVLLTFATITIVAIMSSTLGYSKLMQSSDCHEKAAFLADAGLQAALIRLNAYSDGNISLNQSRTYFSDTNHFGNAEWGFITQVMVTNGQDVLRSVGIYRQHNVQVEAGVSLGAGSRSIHALYAHALFAGNSGGSTDYSLRVGGTGSGADFVSGDTYSGNHIELTGDAMLRMPEALTADIDGDGIYDPAFDSAQHSHAVQVFTNPLDQAAFDAYVASQQSHMDEVYNNGQYDVGEAFVDTIGNGTYDLGEPFTDQPGGTPGVRDPGDEFTDLNGNGSRDAGEPFVDLGNGVYDSGEEWTEDPSMAERQNGRYDGPDGYWDWQSTGHWETRTWWVWTWEVWVDDGASWVWVSQPGLPGEDFEDAGDGVYDPGEPYIDQNGIYDEGEEYLDDRNDAYDYGTQAAGTITGMPTPGPGQQAATGGDASIDPPDLASMHYDANRDGSEPVGALERWGNDVAVTASDYSSNGHVINSASTPEHIFVRNVPRTPAGTGNDQFRETHGGVQVRSRGYDKVYDNNNNPVDDYFLEDPTDSTYNQISSYDVAQNDGNRTHRTLINVQPEDNVKLYYVDGNVWLHATPTWALGFREPGTRITIVANGNITISDEFYYNADYDSNLQYSDMDSTVVNDPSDALCLIALKRPNCDNSGNIYIGDPAMGTGGSIHAMLYAENDFVDNNINTENQQFISVFGNMTAGNQVRLNRQEGGGYYRTRLDVTLDGRIRDGTVIVPGLPHPVGSQRSIQLDTAWHMVPGTWTSWSLLE
jgi:hypothetical protein